MIERLKEIRERENISGPSFSIDQSYRGWRDDMLVEIYKILSAMQDSEREKE